MRRKLSDAVAARIAVDHEFTTALLMETDAELSQAHEALRTARDGLRIWHMNVSYIDTIIGPDGYVEPPFAAEEGGAL